MMPRQIRWFVGLQCLSLFIAPVRLYFASAYTRAEIAADSIFVLLFTTALLALLIWKTAEGNNWARIALLVLFLIGVVPSALALRTDLALSAGLAVLSIAQISLQGCSLIILFSGSANQWFRRAPNPSPKS